MKYYDALPDGRYYDAMPDDGRQPAYRPDPRPTPDPIGETYEALEKGSIRAWALARRVATWANANATEAVLRTIVVLGALSILHIVLQAWMARR